MNRTYWENELRTIETAHRFERGYKLLYCPWKTLNRHELVFLSLNPGARTPRGSNPMEKLVSDERGNSYSIDHSNSCSPMSDQFLRLCEFMQVEPLEVLTGVVAPFRSASWEALTVPQRQASIDFGRRFWEGALRSSPRDAAIIVCSTRAGKLVVSLLDATLEKELQSGWGHYRIRRYRTHEGRPIVGLPHLSRFKLFGRAESKPFLKNALEGIDIPALAR